jgi:hypothetical protein
MAVHHLRNKTSEVTNSDVQDSATVIVKDRGLGWHSG